MSTMEDLLRNMRAYRIGAGKTQKELGELIEKSESQVGAYETGKSEIPVTVVIKMAQVLGVEIEDMFAKNTVSQNSNPAEYDFEFRVFKVEDRRTVAGILAENGYDVGIHRKKRTRTGKTLDYYIHGREVVNSGTMEVE